MKVRDKYFKPYMSGKEIADIVASLGKQLNHDLRDKDPLFLGVLNGSFIFEVQGQGAVLNVVGKVKAV